MPDGEIEALGAKQSKNGHYEQVCVFQLVLGSFISGKDRITGSDGYSARE